MLEFQHGKCAICDKHFPGPKATHLDHDHATGHIRGILCHRCNMGIGFFKDDVEILWRAINYLKIFEEKIRIGLDKLTNSSTGASSN